MKSSGVITVVPGMIATRSTPSATSTGHSTSANRPARNSTPSDSRGAARLAARPTAKWPMNIAWHHSAGDMTRRLEDADFGEAYYALGCGRPYARDDVWMGRFGATADAIVRTLRPRRVLEAACAWGLLVEALRARGVEAFGFDISSYAIE